MACACPPFNEYSSDPCCRREPDQCPPERCKHPEPTARELLAQLEEIHAALRYAKAKRERLRADHAEAQSEVEALCVEVERLERAVLAAARGTESGVETEGAPEGVVARLVAPVANVVDLG